MSLSFKEALSVALIEKKLLTRARLDEALAIQKEAGGDLRDILVRQGFIDSDNLVALASQELGIPLINLSRFKMDPDVIKLIPRDIAAKYHLIPLSRLEEVLTVVIEDPLNLFVLDQITILSSFKIIPVIAAAQEVRAAIDNYYPESAYEELEKIAAGVSSTKVEVLDAPGQMSVDKQALLSFVADAPVVKLVNQILSEAVKARSSDILIEPFEKKTRIRYRIDGILRPIQTFPSVLHTAVVSRFKVMSNLDIAEQRLPQDGRFQIEDGKKLVDFRISVLPSSFGEKVALRILDRSAVVLDIESLGFTAKALADLKESIERPHGMILICGPTGSGKTTTLYSLLMLSSSPEDNVVTVEDPIEYQIEGLNQVCARPDLGLTFASVLRSILRQDPDTIMIGEVRDYETADIAIKSALTGHLLLTTLHATTATGAIVRLMNMGVEPFLISASVILTAAQRLVRRICPKCREPYTLDGAAALNAGFKKKEPLTLYRGRGCGSCSNTGYKGRVGLMETVVSTAEIRQLIASRADEHSIREAAIKSGMVTLRDDGLAKVLTGATTLEEVLRVTAGEQDLATRLD